MPRACKPSGRATGRAWRPSPPALVRAFERATRSLGGAEHRKMFGYPAAFVGGRMFAGLFQDGMVLRLGDEDRARFLGLPGATPFVAMGRQMKEWVVLPPAVLGSPRALAGWLGKALAHGRVLPPKPARATRRRR